MLKNVTPSPSRYPYQILTFFLHFVLFCTLITRNSLSLTKLITTPPDAYPIRPHPNLMSPGRLESGNSLQAVRLRISQATFLNIPIITIRNFLPRMAQVLQIYLWLKTEWRTFGQGVLVCREFETEQKSRSRFGGQELGLTFSPGRAHGRGKRTKELEEKAKKKEER